ncbi:hypothetical protein [Terriglobus albidus]|uniref:hypothetical protein n=1 Tax=Terriglobus albidus TaxID=1592106 RepID=UPI0021E0251F|nr:hypothetical protein [Terriglobus albidus]
MKKLIQLICLVLVFDISMDAQAPKRVHVTGPKALQLISLLISGSNSVRTAVKDQNKSEIIIHDLSILSEATSKYDPSMPMFNLAVYDAKGKVGTAANPTPIGEASALFKFLTGLGLPVDGAMEGSSVNIASISCKINTAADGDAPERFQCDIVNGF